MASIGELCYKFTQILFQGRLVMRKFVLVMLATLAALLMQQAYALLNLELTQGNASAVPIVVVPFAIEGQAPQQDVSAIVSHDLQNSGRFKVFGVERLAQFPSDKRDVHYDYFRKLGAKNIVIGRVQAVGPDRFKVSFQLLDVFGEKNAVAEQNAVLVEKQYVVPNADLRAIAHHISDLIYQQITGVRGIFSTRLAYVLVQRIDRYHSRYTLEVSDQDGYNPRPLLTSADPIMSPSWSPNGRQIAYVSFEKRHAAIYIEDVATGGRYVVSEAPGINGAPAWSPDGRKLALVLSKSGSPNIYTLDLDSRQLTQLTHDFYINTEPSWSTNGRQLIFTSNRSGSPQIYQIDLSSHAVSRVSYEGKYNARASYTPDGNHIVVLNQSAGLYNIGVLDLDTGVFRVLTHSGSDHESPSIAPNSSMVLFGTIYHGRSVLGMAATDGSVQVRLPSRNGDVQDPAWSPFLS